MSEFEAVLFVAIVALIVGGGLTRRHKRNKDRAVSQRSFNPSEGH
jgi:hypothetical protein